MRARALDSSLQKIEEDMMDDPDPYIEIMGRLIEDETDTGIFNWEIAYEETVKDKAYEAPSDVITVSEW
jgi:hypothetical protein